MAGIALHHLVGRFEAGIGDFGNGQLFMVCLFSRDDGSIRGEREMNPGVRHQVGLELRQVDVEGTVKSQRGSDGADDLTDETVKVGVGWSLYVQVAAADVVNSLVIDHKCAVRVFKSSVGS